MPRKLIKHISVCVYEGVSSDNQFVGQGSEVPGWDTHPMCSRQHPTSQVGHLEHRNRRGKLTTWAILIFLPMVQFFLLTLPANIRLQMPQSLNDDSHDSSSSPGTARPSALTGSASLVPLVLRLAASWTKQLLVSLSHQLADSHCGTYLASDYAAQANKYVIIIYTFY
jgi:hypothetical protein